MAPVYSGSENCILAVFSQWMRSCLHHQGAQHMFLNAFLWNLPWWNSIATYIAYLDLQPTEKARRSHLKHASYILLPFCISVFGVEHRCATMHKCMSADLISLRYVDPKDETQVRLSAWWQVLLPIESSHRLHSVLTLEVIKGKGWLVGGSVRKIARS